MSARLLALDEVCAERMRQDAKWGDQSGHPDYLWLAILTEEVGELAQAILQADWENGPSERIRQELVQTAAVAVAWLEALTTRNGESA